MIHTEIHLVTAFRCCPGDTFIPATEVQTELRKEPGSVAGALSGGRGSPHPL